MTATADTRLDSELAKRRGRLRPPDIVMAPQTLGAARLTRYSFNRTLLRTAVRDRWQARRSHFVMDDEGQGEAVYEWQIGDDIYSFVAITQTLDESAHTDRVIAERWEISGALVDGAVDDEMMELLRHEIPKQEGARLTPDVLVLTRGNRSLRFFDYLVQCLADGHQPDADRVGDSGYIMRSTAFYGNGKFGMRSFAGYPPGHPFAVSFRAQFAAAMLFRELSYDVVEHCARVRSPATAVAFDDAWRRYFGLGNATGLGLVPYAFKHPKVLNAWAGIRELALADVRDLDPTAEQLEALRGWIERARNHFATGTDDDCSPFLSPVELAPLVDDIAAAFETVRDKPKAFDRLYEWAATQHCEVQELVVSLLIELHDGDDELIDDLFDVHEHRGHDPAMTAGEAHSLLLDRFGWINDVDLSADGYWWVISDNTEEPRRARHDRIAPDGHDVPIDIALRMHALRTTLTEVDSDTSLAAMLTDYPEHQLAVDRLIDSDKDYCEPRDNACSLSFLPLQLQRFQLAVYGMDNFKPKSTDWLRVTLFQGAPRIDELHTDPPDTWALPPRPKATA